MSTNQPTTGKQDFDFTLRMTVDLDADEKFASFDASKRAEEAEEFVAGALSVLNRQLNRSATAVNAESMPQLSLPFVTHTDLAQRMELLAELKDILAGASAQKG